MFDHSNLHYMQKNHPLVLNIRETLVPEDNSLQNEPKITKIAIGKPGGLELNSNEKWERWEYIYCKACNVIIDHNKDSRLKDLVTSIINTSSAENKINAIEWELEINPCEHTLTLQQIEGVQIASKLMATCADCNISSNLWLCLTCGNLSCGRKNYDGTGGNGHAMAHFQKTGHPLVVKTGTITPDGGASLYCYSCDNDVKDPELPLHLSSLGIDVSQQIKTEKTMTELNLEINLNFTLSKAYEEGKLLVPVYGPGNTGLENLGNSCYMNSVIQVLFSLEPFHNLYYETAIEHLSTCYKEPFECFMCQMSKIMYGLHSGSYSNKLSRQIAKTEDNIEGVEEYQKGIKPSSFKHFFGKDHPEFSSTRQQDALEYMAYLMDKFESHEKVNNRLNPSKYFEFSIESRMECSKCQSVKYKNSKHLFLNLNVPDWINKKDENSECKFDEVISKFLGEENVEMNCKECKESTSWNKTQRIKNFPKYLIIVFQRFVYDWVPIKLETKLLAPTENFDFRVLSCNHSKQNEKIIEDQEDEVVSEEEPKFDQSTLNLLIQNGVPDLAAKHALLSTNNDPDMAISWYFENMDNPTISTPIQKIKKYNAKPKSSSSSNQIEVPDHLSESLASIIGLNKALAEDILRKTNLDFDKAVDAFFQEGGLEKIMADFESSQANKPSEQQSESLSSESQIKIDNPIYDLYAFITHLGKNTSHGHYVCHIKKGDNWIYYNDSKVNVSQDPPIHKAYIYLYEAK